MGLTRDIARFVAGMQFEHVPAPAVPTVCTGFTDCIGVLLAGLAEPVTPIVARAAGLPFDIGAITAFAGGGAVAPDLALIYGTAAHALDFDDTALSGHPSAVLVPAILAEAGDVEADGRAMIAAYVCGYEVWAELIRRDSDPHHQKGWHPSAVFGPIAAAAASAVLRRLDAAQASHALGIAASLAGGVVANFGTMTKPFHVGRAAQSGLVATRLAGQGMTSGDDALEHALGFLQAFSPRGAVDTTSGVQLGVAWRITETGLNVKLYPMCYAVHRALDAMIDLARAGTLAAGHIASVEVELGANQAAILRNHRPRTSLDAKFSLEFAMAAGAIAGRCGPTELSDAFVQRADVQDFFGKVSARTIVERDSEEPALAPFDRVRLVLRDGRALASEPVRHPRGHFRRPVDRDQLWQKFNDCALGAVRPDRARHLFEALQDLPRLSSVRDLARLDRRAAGAVG